MFHSRSCIEKEMSFQALADGLWVVRLAVCWVDGLACFKRGLPYRVLNDTILDGGQDGEGGGIPPVVSVTHWTVLEWIG